MNKIAFIVALSTCFIVSGGVLAEEEKSAKQLCEEYAKEEDISKEELDDYIAQCIVNLSGVEEAEIPERESGSDTDIK